MSNALQLTASLRRGGEDGCYEMYHVPSRENQTVLDVVTWVQRNVNATPRIDSPAWASPTGDRMSTVAA
jgi:hypothetical protein